MKTTLVALLMVAAAVSPCDAGAPAFRGVGDLSGGTEWSEALGVSPDGTTVVGTSSSNTSPSQAYGWQNGTMVGLQVPGGGTWLFRAHAVSDGGRVIVGRIAPTGRFLGEAVVWDDGQMTRLGFLGGASGFESEALGVTADGSKITGTSTNGTGEREAFVRIWPDGSMVGLGIGPDGSDSSALGISSDGALMAGATISGPGYFQAARFDGDGAPTLLPHLPEAGGSSYAFAISADGSTIVGYSQSMLGTEAVRWTPDLQVHALGAAEAGVVSSVAQGVSASGGTIVGGAVSGTGNGVAFYWDATHGFRVLEDVLTQDYGLDLTGWDLIEAHGISADGQVIVGDGINPSGNGEGWVAILDNSPRLAVSKTQLSWIQPLHPSGTKWDIVVGSLTNLRATGGDFQQATLHCVANNVSSMSRSYATTPGVNEGSWFLVRETGGSYDLTYGNQVASRDSAIAASGNACP